jgi:hypothetical protein
MTVLMARFWAFRRYTYQELSVSCEGPSSINIHINGSMVHYYMVELGIVGRMCCVSLGGCTLQIQSLVSIAGAIKVTGIYVDMNQLNVLFNSTKPFIRIDCKLRCITVKYHTNVSLGKGPSMVFGCNGGIQWVGNPMHISQSLHYIICSMNKGMLSKGFLQCTSQSHEMVKNIYPKGVSRVR